ncbi:unnamed protein product [Rotaria sp. Silwood2]|nr:unnamed protein product [Rotaria sp. Silwood2]
MASNETFPQIAYPIRVILPIVYTIITVIVLIGNTLNFYSLCISTDRFGRKSIHVLIWNLITEGTIWTLIFYIVKMVSYADLGEHFALNNGKWLNDLWCKSEMYILRIMDFVLAYTIVFLCLDRCVKRKKCCYGQRRFVSGICISISIWLAICYALIPILFFNQQLKSLNYGSYECIYNETQINQLTCSYMHSRKRSTCFVVTINHITWAVSQEAYRPPLDPIIGLPSDQLGYHHHIFLRFKERYFLLDVR